METPIASTKIVGVRPDGERIEIEFLICNPYLNESSPIEQWRCPVSVKPLYGGVFNIAGADSLQALCMALDIGLGQLASFKEHGGQLLNDDGTEFSIEAYKFSSQGQSNA